MNRLVHPILKGSLRASGWIRYGRKYDAPLRPDRLLWLDPSEIVHRPVNTPQNATIPPTLIVGGDWDEDLDPITDDIVYETFHRRFVDGEPWGETGYVEFLMTDRSEHGGLTRSEAERRCERIDKLYRFIDEDGYRTQSQLEEAESLIEELTHSRRPPVYREVSVDVTRDGEFVWHAGMHRLVIAKLVDIDRLPVRVNIRHELWQEVRENAFQSNDAGEYRDHPDICYLIDEIGSGQ